MKVALLVNPHREHRILERSRKMTRETKAGLVVSCSFLCLVGTVFVCKWREKVAADRHAAVEEASNEPQKIADPGSPLKAEPPSAAAGGKSGNGTVAPSGKKETSRLDQLNFARLPLKSDQDRDNRPAPKSANSAAEKKATVTPGSAAASASSVQPPPAASIAGPSWDGMDPGNSTKEKSAGLAKSAAPAGPPSPAVDFGKLAPNSGLTESATSAPKLPRAEASGKSPLAGSGGPQPKKEVAESPAKKPAQDKALVTIPDPPPSMMLPLGPMSLPGKDAQQNTSPGLDSSRVADLDKKNNGGAAPDKRLASGAMPPATLSGDPKWSQAPVSSPWGNNTPNGAGAASGQSAGNPSSKSTPTIGDSPWSAPPSFAKGPAGVNPTAISPKDTGSGSVRALSSSSGPAPSQAMTRPSHPSEMAVQPTPAPSQAVKPVIPPLVVKAPADESVQTTAPGSAEVESYDEEAYACKANDTFRSISLAYYHTDRYERALQLFNRNHPLATQALRQDTVILQPGLNVYIPPKRILDKYYVGAAAAAASGASDKAAQAPAQGSAATAVSEERTFRVKNNGEMFREIARSVLGDPERWTEIYRLNPRFDPAEPIPSGTELRVPSQARVDARPTP
jgi:hypothetical protein